MIAPMRADFYSQCQNIQYDQTLMVPALFFEDMCPMLKNTHMRYYWPYTLPWDSQLQAV
jgi:hypothetical protein